MGLGFTIALLVLGIFRELLGAGTVFGVTVDVYKRQVLVCRKLYAQPYDPACFIDKSCDEKWYPNKDYHTMYIAEIEKVLVD